MIGPSDSRHLRVPTTDPRIVLVDHYGKKIFSVLVGRCPDEHIAKVLRSPQLSYGARCIGLDLYRDRECLSLGRHALNAVLSQHQNIVTVMKFPDEERNRNSRTTDILQGTDQIGFNDIMVDPGGIVRRGFLFSRESGGNGHLLFVGSRSQIFGRKKASCRNPDPTSA